jgi:hypothetical protein
MRNDSPQDLISIKRALKAVRQRERDLKRKKKKEKRNKVDFDSSKKPLDI